MFGELFVWVWGIFVLLNVAVKVIVFRLIIELIYVYCRKLGRLWNKWVGEVFMSIYFGVIVIVVGLGSVVELEEWVGSVIVWGL